MDDEFKKKKKKKKKKTIFIIDTPKNKKFNGNIKKINKKLVEVYKF
jgi:hypothetical protein